jgi:DNA topoisomerase-1
VQTKEESEQNNASLDEPKILGTDPATGRTVSLRKGPYGVYVQIDPPATQQQVAEAEPDEVDSKGKKKKKKAAPQDKPKRQGVPRGVKPDDVTLEAALSLLALPRLIGYHPETKEKMEAGIGRFGPYIKYKDRFKSIPAGDDVLTIGMNRAVELISQLGEKKTFTRKKKADDGDTKTAKKSPAKKKIPAKKTTSKPKKSA